jgi:WD40 repeat protein
VELMSLSAQDMRIITGVAFSPDGSRVMSGEESMTVKTWDISPSGDAEWANLPAASYEAAPIDHPSSEELLAFMPTGPAVLVSGSNNSVNLWDPQAWPNGPIRRFRRPGHGCCAFGVDVSSDGATIAVSYCDGTVSVRDFASGREVLAVETHQCPPLTDLHPSGEYLAIGGVFDGAAGYVGPIRILDRSGRVVSLLRDEGRFRVEDAVFSPDGRLIATTGYYVGPGTEEDYRVRIWDWRRAEVITRISGYAERLAFDPNGTRIAGTRYGQARIWDVQLLALSGAAASWDVAFSPDGSMLASTTFDGTARVWALDIDDLLEIARQNVTRSLTDEECRQYLNLQACPNL